MPLDPNSFPRIALGGPQEFAPPQTKVPFGVFTAVGSGSDLSPGTSGREGIGFGQEDQA